MGAAEDANKAAVESVAKKLEWVEHPPPVVGSVSRIGIASPTAPDSGSAILTRPKTMVVIPLRENSARFSSRVRVTQVGAGPTTFRVTINATNVDYVAGAGETLQQILEGIRDAINGFGPPVSNVVVASVRDADEDTVDDEILIQQLASETATHTTAASIVAGTGLIEADEDITSLSVDIWGKMAGTNAPAQWTRARAGVFSSIDRKGIHERISSAAYERMYVELTSVAAPTGGATLTKVITSLGTGIV